MTSLCVLFRIRSTRSCDIFFRLIDSQVFDCMVLLLATISRVNTFGGSNRRQCIRGCPEPHVCDPAILSELLGSVRQSKQSAMDFPGHVARISWGTPQV